MSGTSLLILFLLIVGFILFTRRFVPKLWNAEIGHHIVDPININEFKKNPLSYLPDGFFDTTTAKSKCDNCNTIKEQDLHLKKAYLYFEDTDHYFVIRLYKLKSRYTNPVRVSAVLRIIYYRCNY